MPKARCYCGSRPSRSGVGKLRPPKLVAAPAQLDSSLFGPGLLQYSSVSASLALPYADILLSCLSHVIAVHYAADGSAFSVISVGHSCLKLVLLPSALLRHTDRRHHTSICNSPDNKTAKPVLLQPLYHKQPASAKLNHSLSTTDWQAC